MRSVKLASPETILKVYYGGIELGSAEIKELFGGGLSSKTIARLKKEVADAMQKRGLQQYRTSEVDRDVAFEIWGIDIKKIERCRKKQLELQV